MGDKPFAGILAAVALAPVCAVCILGPAAIGSFFGGAFGWLVGFDPVVGVALAILGGMLIVAFLHRRKQRSLLRGRTATSGGPIGVGSFKQGAVPDRVAPLEVPQSAISAATESSQEPTR